ncbi:hypothetical protein GOP47_0024974 [Adiantum capillus-veneris]|uniref:Uncharacterized protein n=1 Tax=Adiantum capillus-veneris TaxID=13818 RepID=A0A9D4U501_ADICA|nr:hypothetical protein GOP47_0024974 [Adiantum capillus-veneris]
MKQYPQNAGLATGFLECSQSEYVSPYALRLVLEPEAASLHCLHRASSGFQVKEISRNFRSRGGKASPYLMKRVRGAFETRVRAIFSPPNPGSAICDGAVLFSMSQEPVTCRVSRKTYGIKCTRDLIEGEDPEEYLSGNDDGDEECENAFCIYVRKGDTVLYDHSIENIFYPTSHKQKKLHIELYSSTELNPGFLPDQSCVMEGQIEVDISKDLQMDMTSEICVSMRFGTSMIELSAKGLNFGDGDNLGMLPINFQHAMDVVS